MFSKFRIEYMLNHQNKINISMYHLKPPAVWRSLFERRLMSLVKPSFQIWELMVELRPSLLTPWRGYCYYYLLEEMPHYPLLPQDDFIATVSLILSIKVLSFNLVLQVCDSICCYIIGILAVVDCCPKSLELEEKPNMLAAR